ncbi:GtrA family protein [Propylenella binzhouense]|uniref:GtrA family protein n=1 Tax=Propylenella binzhouense TaxID=2555902 RepID=A0A964WTJ7_9HYPH|nr:GtrA family protein [Propylenella binzhouense]MYZ47915.1 GtrA family protein [Propylenella binzhouense]
MSGAGCRTEFHRLLRFSVVGTGGFLVDVAVLQLCLSLGLDPYSGRAVSFLAAVTFTWALNRAYTFDPSGRPIAVEWVSFVAACSAGGAVNYAVYAVLVASLAAPPGLAVAAGSLAGLAVNFLAARRIVFR